MGIDIKKLDALPQTQKEAVMTDLFNIELDAMKKMLDIKLVLEKQHSDYLRANGLITIDPKDGRIAELEEEVRKLKEENAQLKHQVQELKDAKMTYG